MLWTLHELACEAKRASSIPCDPTCVKIDENIDDYFVGHFGIPMGTPLAPVRAATMENLIRRWLSHHPRGLIVSIGESLETQRRDGSQVRALLLPLGNRFLGQSWCLTCPHRNVGNARLQCNGEMDLVGHAIGVRP